MKLITKPVLVCTEAEYETEIEPSIERLLEVDLCPNINENRNTTWDCDAFESCSCCPFGKANAKIQEAIQILRDIKVEETS